MNREEDASRMDNQIATYLMIEKDGYAGQMYVSLYLYPMLVLDIVN